MNNKNKFSPNPNRLKINRILLNACLLSGIAWFVITSALYYEHKNKYVYYHKYILPHTVIVVSLIIAFVLTNYILYKLYGTSEVNIDCNVKNKSVIVFDTVLRAATMLFIGYIISAFTFLFWSNLILGY